MNRTWTRWIAISVLFAVSASASAQSSKDWIDIKNPTELRALFSNKTHRGKGPDGVPYVAHFSSDGRGQLLLADQKHPRTWEVKGSEVCITAATPVSGTTCRAYQRHKTNRNDVVGRQANGWIVQFTAEEGIPKF